MPESPLPPPPPPAPPRPVSGHAPTTSGSTAAVGPSGAASTTAPPGRSTSSIGGSDWPRQATDTIVSLVDSVKGKTTGPATSLVRGVVYGTLAAIVGTAALVLTLVLLLRAIDVGVDALLDLADADRNGRSTWIAHTILGLPMLLAGLWCWRKGGRAAVD